MTRLEMLLSQLHDFTTAATVYSGRCDFEFSQTDVNKCRLNLRDALKMLDEVEGALEDESND